MRKIFIITGIVVPIILALPTIINMLLFLQYEHGREYLDKRDGPSGILVGTWQGTFDTYQCGIDERHRFMLVFDTDSTGIFEYEFDHVRHIVGMTDVYEWRSLFPYNRSETRRTVDDIRVIDKHHLAILQRREFAEANDTTYARFELRADRLYFSYITEPGDEIEHWGIPFSWPDLEIRWSDLIVMWWH